MDTLTPNMSKSLNDFTRKDFMALPQKAWDEDIGPFQSLVIIPERYYHDSGFRCMTFIAVDNKNRPFCCLGGRSDVIHLDGVGGFGKDWTKRYNGVPNLVPPSSWNIDCLPKSGLLRLFTNGTLTTGTVLSSFDLYSERKSKL